MPNFKLTIAYDGTTYHGWQVQPGVRTIQAEVEAALGRILDRPIAIHGSGRTDRGVHATGQVAHFLAETPCPRPDTLRAGVNALLPPDIRVRDIVEVGPAFHARYSALSKTYRYSISRSRVQDPFRHRYQYWFPRALEAGPVDRATGRLRGTHDFTSLSAGSDEVRDAVRDIYEAAWARGPEEWVFTVRGSGFLRSMVRRMVGTLIDVGLGRIGWEQMDAILEARDREAGGPTAPANGLTLARVYYGSGAGAPGGVTG